MNEVKTVKFKQVAYCLRYVLFLSLMGLLVKMHPDIVNELALPSVIGFLKPYVGEIMFIVGTLVFVLMIYAFDNIVLNVIRYLLVIMPLIMLSRSFYLMGGILVSLNLIIWSTMTIALLLIQLYKSFKAAKIFDYWGELLTFFLLFIPGIIIVLSQLEIINWEKGATMVTEAIVMLFAAALSLVLILINSYYQNTGSRVAVSFLISLLCSYLFYRFFIIGSFANTLHYGLLTVWVLITAFLRESDFKLNG